jgi:hypothetical protein
MACLSIAGKVLLNRFLRVRLSIAEKVLLNRRLSIAGKVLLSQFSLAVFDIVSLKSVSAC